MEGWKEGMREAPEDGRHSPTWSSRAQRGILPGMARDPAEQILRCARDDSAARTPHSTLPSFRLPAFPSSRPSVPVDNPAPARYRIRMIMRSAVWSRSATLPPPAGAMACCCMRRLAPDRTT